MKKMIFPIFLTLLVSPLGTGATSAKDRVAVLDFESIPANPDLAQSVSEILRTELINLRQYEVVERAAIEKILNEQKLRLSDAIDEKDAIRIGRLAGANLVVIGSIVKIGSTYTLNSRFIEVETGIAREGKSLRCQNEDEISNLCHQLARSAAKNPPPESAVGKKLPNPTGKGYLVIKVDDEMNENCPEVILKLGNGAGIHFYREIPGEYLGNLHGYDRYKFSFEEKIVLPAGKQELTLHIPSRGNFCKGIDDKRFSFTLSPGETKVLQVSFKNFLISRGWQATLEE